MIADNRLAEIAFWDDRLLAEQLKELAPASISISRSIGFEMGEIDLRIASLDDYQLGQYQSLFNHRLVYRG